MKWIPPLFKLKYLTILLVTGSCLPFPLLAGGVTLITHGFGGNVTEWVIPMADRIPRHPAFAATNVTSYQLSLTQNAQGVFQLTPQFLDGVSLNESDSGEIIISLDWSTVSGLFQASTAAVAAEVAAGLLATNLIPELQGRALAELPFHFVGHSRGASVVAELARELGARGAWVDHLTFLDPFPLSLNGDPAMKIYENVFFADNYWQNTDFPQGQAVPGAFNRFLSNLNGGYSSGQAHSDVHLWYHGTIDLATPTSDNLAILTAAERITWWSTEEANGTNTGFRYSHLGRGNRFSTNSPAGPQTDRIVDGVNQRWDVGAGTSQNRSNLPTNNHQWPNPIRFQLLSTHLSGNDPLRAQLYYQAGSATAKQYQIYLDNDQNPFNGMVLALAPGDLPTTTSVASMTLSNGLAGDQLSPGTYYVLARLTDGVRTRYLYSAEPLTFNAVSSPVTLDIQEFMPGGLVLQVVGGLGQTVAIQSTADLSNWTTLVTTNLDSENVSLLVPREAPRQYFRAQVLP